MSGASLGLLGLLLAAPCAGEELPACVRRTDDGIKEPESLTGLLLCQESALKAADPENPARRDELAGLQKSELEDYLARHPDQAPKLEKARGDAKKKMEGLAKNEAAAGRNLSRVSPEDADALRELQKTLTKESGGGAFGLTPEGAQAIVKLLHEKQGGPTVEMNELLKSLQKDGTDLKAETMLQLKQAARAADAEGLESGLDPEMQKWLLNPSTDPKAPPAQIPLN